MCVDREQQNSYNEGEQNPIEDIKRALEMLAGCCTNAITSLQELAEQNKRR